VGIAAAVGVFSGIFALHYLLTPPNPDEAPHPTARLHDGALLGAIISSCIFPLVVGAFETSRVCTSFTKVGSMFVCGSAFSVTMAAFVVVLDVGTRPSSDAEGFDWYALLFVTGGGFLAGIVYGLLRPRPNWTFLQ
jgi:hypothetical protein